MASSQLHDGLETPEGVVPPSQKGWQRQGRVGKCVPPHGSSYAAAVQAKTFGHPLCDLHMALIPGNNISEEARQLHLYIATEQPVHYLASASS